MEFFKRFYSGEILWERSEIVSPQVGCQLPEFARRGTGEFAVKLLHVVVFIINVNRKLPDKAPSEEFFASEGISATLKENAISLNQHLTPFS